MENEVIEVLMPKAWLKSDYYSIVFSNLKIYLIRQTDLKVHSIERLIFRLAEYAQREKEEEEMVKNITLEDVQSKTIQSYEYNSMIEPAVKKGFGEVKITFKYPTGGRFIKTSWNEIGFPSEHYDSLSQYLVRRGFWKQ